MVETKQSRRRFLAKAAAAMATPSLANLLAPEAQAHDFRIPLGLDFAINSPFLPIDYTDRRFLNHINRFNFLIGADRHHRTHQPVVVYVENHYPVNLETHCIDDPLRFPQTFISGKWIDGSNGQPRDGYASLGEHRKLNDKEFTTGETVLAGLALPIQGVKGKRFRMEVYDPSCKLIDSKDGRIENNNGFEKIDLNVRNALAKGGEGTYSVAFYLNGRDNRRNNKITREDHWDTRQFNLVYNASEKPSFTTGTANGWNDKNRDGIMSEDERFTDSVLFGPGDDIYVYTRALENTSGTKSTLWIQDSDGKSFLNHEKTISRDGEYHACRLSDGKLPKGDYTAISVYGGKWDRKDFMVSSNDISPEQLRESRLIGPKFP